MSPHVKCVVGSTDARDDETVPRLSHLFYQRLVAGMDYEQAFKMGATEVDFKSRTAADAYKLLVR